MNSLVSFFLAVATFSDLNLHNFVPISHLVLLWGSKNKNKFVEIDIFRQQFPLIKLWEVILKKFELWKIYHTEYGPSLVSDWQETNGSGRVMG